MSNKRVYLLYPVDTILRDAQCWLRWQQVHQHALPAVTQVTAFEDLLTVVLLSRPKCLPLPETERHLWPRLTDWGKELEAHLHTCYCNGMVFRGKPTIGKQWVEDNAYLLAGTELTNIRPDGHAQRANTAEKTLGINAQRLLWLLLCRTSPLAGVYHPPLPAFVQRIRQYAGFPDAPPTVTATLAGIRRRLY